ncbi:PEP-CTERM sorting domain-containing protein [Emcibacter nanhaiensis]|uniref:PEP-CTERM sorting domain-containing protein n=1 Tax=Emcibacter nanhaiensis TaxID=1505037 RepID=A0A501PAP4_9PROT|nr:PEP-CTERM sorting domain-containing protein [Emcibacter nanhaiensis]TPD57430.1 PEP-CTERM sorting domain-containing protein [Emcibacter nanhaiensis]
MTKAIVKILMGVFAVFLMAETASATIYSVNRTIGAGGVTGTITTDGTLGALSAGNVTDWNLLLDDGSTTFNLLGNGSVGDNSDLLISGAAFIATATDLWFDFAAQGFALFQNPTNGSGINWWCLEGPSSGCTGFGQGESVVTTSPALGEHVLYTTRQIISGEAVDADEPAMLGLLALGLGGLLLGRRRKA